MIKFIFWLMWITGAVAVILLSIHVAKTGNPTALHIIVALCAGLIVSGISTFATGTDYHDDNDLPEQ